MLNLIRRYRFYITLAILILIPIVSLNLSDKERRNGDLNFMERGLLFFTSPVQSLITFGIDESVRGMENYVFLLHTHRDFAAVVEENRRLLNIIHNYKEMEAENKRLRALLQLHDKLEDNKIAARVIAKDANSEFRAIRINKGSADGILRGMPVVTHEGIVGKVLRTQTHYSDVITVLDNLSSVDALLQRSRARGVLEGATDYSCVLKYALRTDDIEVGDVVLSSGLDGVFPKGLMLGVVSGVAKQNYGITQDVEVRPSVDFTKLEEVIVVLKPDRLLL